MRKFLLWLTVIGALLSGGYWLWPSNRETISLESKDMVKVAPLIQAPPTIETPAPALSVPSEPSRPKIWTGVPFTSQAPTGDWSRSEFQDGCEEASAIMVWLWRQKKSLTKEQVRQTMLSLARYQERRIGQGVDTDAKTTAEVLLGEYFEITDYSVYYDFPLDELRQATAEGLVIVPTNGRSLANPNYTRPGPLQHMLVITGYDAATKEFITNDPGTRRGENYRYSEQTLYDAIREYPTGKHLPIVTERKAMIVIPPNDET